MWSFVWWLNGLDKVQNEKRTAAVMTRKSLEILRAKIKGRDVHKRA